MNYFLILPNKRVFQKIEKISLLYKKLLKNCMFFIEKKLFYETNNFTEQSFCE